MSRALAITALLTFISLPALASPGQAAAQKLAEGQANPSEAAAAWAEAGVSPKQALALVSSLELKEAKKAHHSTNLVDGFQRTTDLQVRMPETPLDSGKYGVLIALHGLGGHSGQLLGFTKKVAPKGVIVVAPGAKKLSRDQEGEDTFGVGLASRLPHWWSYKTHSFPFQALSYLKQRYPIDTNRVYILGYSMGGYGTWNVGLRYPDRFAAIVPLAGGISRVENMVQRDAKSRKLLTNALMVPSFFVHGSADRTVPCRFSKTIAADLKQLGAEHHYTEVPGQGHYLRGFLDGNDVTQRLVEFLQAKVRDPNPKTVVHSVLGTYHGSSYWLRVDEAPKGGDVMAEAKGNTIKVIAEGVRKLTIFLDPDVVDVNAPVTIEVNKTVYHDGLVKPSLKAVAESFADDRDPELTYSRQVVIDLGL